MTDEAAEYVVVLKPTADATDPAGVRRLRSLLKVALRRFGLQCVRCEPVAEGVVTSDGEKA